MGKLKIGERTFEADCLIFDKDGTLIDFDHTWGKFVKTWVDQILGEANISADQWPAWEAHLGKSLGFDPITHSVLPDSPLAVTTLGKIEVVVMTALYQLGKTWDQCEMIMAAVRENPIQLTADDIEPLGNVESQLQKLHAAGFTLVLATNDERSSTLETIKIMGIGHYFALVLCGDDPHPSKPDPAGIHIIETELNIAPNRMIMFGDTLSDMQFAQNGKINACVGIGRETDGLSALADIVIQTIDAIEPVAAL